jgi:hypothetical protein
MKTYQDKYSELYKVAEEKGIDYSAVLSEANGLQGFGQDGMLQRLFNAEMAMLNARTNFYNFLADFQKSRKMPQDEFVES